MSIKKAIKNYIENHQEFYATDLISHVRWVLNKPQLFDSSILRKLRELREEGLNIECVDHRRARYKVKKEGRLF